MIGGDSAFNKRHNNYRYGGITRSMSQNHTEVNDVIYVCTYNTSSPMVRTTATVLRTQNEFKYLTKNKSNDIGIIATGIPQYERAR